MNLIKIFKRRILAFSFRLFMKIYKSSSPAKKMAICETIRDLRLQPENFRPRLQFRGKFQVKVPGYNTFSMINNGGFIETEIFWKGLFKTWEKDVGSLWIDLCKCSDVIFDVGANSGIYSLVAKAVNRDAEIIAFEPAVSTFEKLTANVVLNKFSIHCEQLAVSNLTTDQVFYDIPDENQTTASLSPEKMKNWDGYSGGIIEYKVQTITLKEYIELNKFQKVDLIKIDIEMHEPEAIEGLGNYINLYKPIILLEVLSKDVATKLNNLIDLKNFQLFHLKKDSKAERIYEFEIHTKDIKVAEWNYILFHNDLEEKIRQNTTLFPSSLPI